MQVTAQLSADKNDVTVTEKPGVQVVRVVGTRQWFASSSDAGGRPLFSVDFDRMHAAEYPITVYYGPQHQPLFWFSGKFDKYYGDSYTQRIVEISGGSGTDEATLCYTAEHPPQNLVMPTRLTLVPGKIVLLQSDTERD